jgi:hypothetical protein
VSLGAVPFDLPECARHDEGEHLVLDPPLATLGELALGFAAHLLGDPGRDDLKINQGQVVLRHPAQGADGA